MPFTFQALIRILSLDHSPSPRSAFTLGTLGVELIKNEEILVYFNFLVGSSSFSSIFYFFFCIFVVVKKYY